jgi:hypothetical protein
MRHSRFGLPRSAAAIAFASSALLLFGLATAQVAVQASEDVDANRLEASYNSGSTLVRDPAVDAYLKRILDRLIAANAEANAMPVRIRALRAPLPYAFGLDNGALYVSTGLLARLRNESQLAGLIAAEIAPTVRRDDLKSQETARQRTVRRAIPNILFITATGGLGALALAKSDNTAQRNVDTQLRLESDQVAMRWVQQAGYTIEEVPRGLERVRDALSAEQRFGLTELANVNGLNARIDSLRRAMPTAAPAPAESATAAPTSSTDELPALARRFTLEIAREDINSATSTGITALLDRLDSEAGANGETACLRAEFVRRSITDPARMPEAITAYQTCVGFADAPVTAFRELAFLQRRHGDMASARANFAEYLKRAPNAADAPIVRGYMQGQ